VILALMPQSRPIGNAPANWRFPLFVVILLGATPIAMSQLGLERGLLAGFDAAAAVFLVSCAFLFRHGAGHMRAAATSNDAGRVLRLILAVLLAVVVFAAMAALILDRQRLTAPDKALITATLALVWLFANTMYALHYAHLYYASDEDGYDRAGLSFPGTHEPLMPDFAYFAFTIGVALQTADVAVSSRRIRNVVTAHEIVAFVFNIGVLALTINVLGSG
jgi:uncharacterized membrane protein